VRLRTAACPNCAAPTRLETGASTAKCPNCGNEVSLADALSVERRYAKRFPNPTPLQPGMKGQFQGKEYEIIGRVVFSMVEEGETYYWNEFQLLAPDGDVRYLEFDEGHWKISEPFIPKTPLSPSEARKLSAGDLVAPEGSPVNVTQVAQATVRHIEGELTYRAMLGDKSMYLDAGSGTRVYSMEWTEDEVSYYRGERLTERQVLVMFGRYEEIAALEAQERRLASRRRFALVCLFAGFLAFLGWINALTPGRVVGQGSAAIAQIPDDGIRFGPIPVKQTSRVHRLRVGASLREEAAWVGAAIETPAQQELFGVARDMWDESGYDSDGAWHESDLQAQTDFVPAQAGEYYVRLYSEPEGRTGTGYSSSPGRTFTSSGSASFELQEGVLYPWYLLWYSLLAFLIGGIYLLAGSPSMRQSIGEAMQSGDDD
jgi:hypothetical protein